VSTTTPDVLKTALEQARELAYTPNIEREDALGWLLHKQPASVWEEPLLLDYCARHFGVDAKELQEASIKIQHAKQQGSSAAVCLYLATQPGVSTPLAGVIHAALGRYWWQNMRRWLPGSMGFPTVESSEAWCWTKMVSWARETSTFFPTVESSEAWCWGVSYGLNGRCRMHGARDYTAVFKTEQLALRVSRDEGIHAAVFTDIVGQWGAEMLTPNDRSDALQQILEMERKGMGWLSAHLELGAQATERQAAAMAARIPFLDPTRVATLHLSAAEDLMRVVDLLRSNVEWWARSDG
jgi:hypothetical protein